MSKKSTVEDMLEVIEGFKSASMPAVIAREESVYVAAAGNYMSNPSSVVERKTLVCFNCNKTGHKASDCYQRLSVTGLNPTPNAKPKKFSSFRHHRNVSRGRFQRQFDDSGRRIREPSVRRQNYSPDEHAASTNFNGTPPYQPRNNYERKYQGPPARYKR